MAVKRRGSKRDSTLSLEEKLTRLQTAINKGVSKKTCLRYWSDFIRSSDGHRCVLCKSAHALSAHHVSRKVLFPDAQFMTGNGITLCRSCHDEAHWGFNGNPDVTLPMDAEGGEKIEYLTHLYVCLAEAAKHNCPSPEHYFLSEQVLAEFKMLQGFEWDYELLGTPIEQAAAIWRATPVNTFKALLNANSPGFVERNPGTAENIAASRERIFVIKTEKGSELFAKISY